MKKNIFILILTLATTAKAWQFSTEPAFAALLHIQPKPSVYKEMNNYFLEKDSALNATSYVESFISDFHIAMVNEALNSVSQKVVAPGCTSLTRVDFPEQLTEKHNSDAQKYFEENFVKVQSYACLGRLNLDKVFETMMSYRFQTKAIPGLVSLSLDPETNKACVKTSVFGVGDSNYCLTKNVFKNPNQYVIHSFNEENFGTPSAPIYFKETINVITQLASGEVSLYTLMYARGPNLSFRSVVKNQVTLQQEKISELLKDMAR